MTSDEDDEQGRTDDERRAQAALSELHVRRRECIRAREQAELTDGDLLRWQTALLAAIEACRPWRSRTARDWTGAGPDWLEDGLDGLHRVTGPVEMTVVETVGFGRLKETTTRRERVCSFRTLLELSRALEDCAEQMGLESGPASNPDEVAGGII